MPVPTIPNAISLSSIQTEFGGSNPISISEYYAGASPLLVPSGTANATSVAIPTSGAISFSNFSGASSLAATLNNYNSVTYNIELYDDYIDIGGSIAFSEVGIRLNSDGTAAYYYTDTGTAETNFTSFTWKTGGGSVGDYYAYMYAPTGDAFVTSSDTATALALSTSRTWRVSATAGGGENIYKSLTSTLEIRNASGTVLASKTLQFIVNASTTL
jgi:hypothetical protein